MNKLQALFRSDGLKELAELLRKLPAFSPLLKEVIQIWFIVDANIIQEQLRWRLGKREKASARSGFHEAVDSGLFVPIAPTHLKSEIEEHLIEIAAETGRTVDEAKAEWEQIQASLVFYRPNCSSNSETSLADPDDVPYKQASDELGLPIYSRDKGFRAAKVPLIAVCLDLTARDYARAASVTLGATYHTTVTITFAYGAFNAFCRMVKSIFAAFRRLPSGLQIAAAGLLAILLIHPKTRGKLVAGVRGVWNKALDMSPDVFSAIAEIFDELGAAQTEVNRTRAEINSALPPPRKRTALMHIRATLTVSKAPLSIGELAERIQAQGYVSQAQDFKAYLRRVMRKSKQFLEVSPGIWSLRSASGNVT